MKILGPDLKRESECETILRSLPQWFGIEASLQMYARDSGAMPTFATQANNALTGFITLAQHFPQSWEVHCIAVHASARGQGIGSALLAHTERWLAAQGVRYLQIKTIADTNESPSYAQTRAFYLAKGYTPLEVFPMLWSPTNPALQLVKTL